MTYIAFFEEVCLKCLYHSFFYMSFFPLPSLSFIFILEGRFISLWLFHFLSLFPFVWLFGHSDSTVSSSVFLHVYPSIVQNNVSICLILSKDHLSLLETPSVWFRTVCHFKSVICFLNPARISPPPHPFLYSSVLLSCLVGILNVC